MPRPMSKYLDRCDDFRGEYAGGDHYFAHAVILLERCPSIGFGPAKQQRVNQHRPNLIIPKIWSITQIHFEIGLPDIVITAETLALQQTEI